MAVRPRARGHRRGPGGAAGDGPLAPPPGDEAAQIGDGRPARAPPRLSGGAGHRTRAVRGPSPRGGLVGRRGRRGCGRRRRRNAHGVEGGDGDRGRRGGAGDRLVDAAGRGGGGCRGNASRPSTVPRGTASPRTPRDSPGFAPSHGEGRGGSTPVPGLLLFPRDGPAPGAHPAGRDASPDAAREVLRRPVVRGAALYGSPRRVRGRP